MKKKGLVKAQRRNRIDIKQNIFTHGKIEIILFRFNFVLIV